MPLVTLVNSSCFDFLAALEPNSVDLVCIDPPYEAHKKTGFANGSPTGCDVDRLRVSLNFGN